MTIISQRLQNKLNVAVDNCLISIPARVMIDPQVILDCYWDEDQQEAGRNMRWQVNSSCWSILHGNASMDVTLPDTVPVAEDDVGPVRVHFAVYDPAHKGLVPDLQKPVLADAPPSALTAYQGAIETLAYRGYERALVSRIKWYIEAVRSLEELRYLLPATSMLLRMAEEHELAAKVEQVRKRPTLMQPLESFDIAVIRWLNQWFGVQVLLETFNKTMPEELGTGTTKLTLSDKKQPRRIEFVP